MNIKFIEIEETIIPILSITKIKFSDTENGNVKIVILANGCSLYESKEMTRRDAKAWLKLRLNIIWENENV